MALAATEERAVDEVVEILRSGQRLLFITGAGLSADSGLPTYRGVGGLYNPGKRVEHGATIEEILSGPMLRVRPELTWKYLLQVGQAVQGATFNRGHEVIASLEQDFEVWTLTQNVDGFHRAAGSRNVIDIHGDLHVIICTSRLCGYRQEVKEFAPVSLPPRCPRCEAALRPDVVLFEEALPVAKLMQLAAEIKRGFDLVFSVGTSSLFPYIVEPVYAAKDRGTPTIEINPGTTDVSHEVDIRILSGAAAALDAIWTRYQSRRG